MLKFLLLITLLIIISVSEVYSFNANSWMRIGRIYCAKPRDEDKYEALFRCDEKITEARKNLLSECMWELNAKRLNNDEPIICQYYNLETLKHDIDECMFQKQDDYYINTIHSFSSANKTSKTIGKLIHEIEYEYQYCVLLIDRSYGFEHLCEMKLTDEQTIAIKKCEKIIPKMVKIIRNCMKAKSIEPRQRPPLCDNLEYSQVGDCSEAKYKKLDQEKLKDYVETKLPQYIKCLKEVIPK